MKEYFISFVVNGKEKGGKTTNVGSVLSSLCFASRCGFNISHLTIQKL